MPLPLGTLSAGASDTSGSSELKSEAVVGLSTHLHAHTEEIPVQNRLTKPIEIQPRGTVHFSQTSPLLSQIQLTSISSSNRNSVYRSPTHFERRRRNTDEDCASINSSSSSYTSSFSKNFLFGFYASNKNPLKGGTVLSKEYWMKDESSKECFSCARLFNTFRRKHHCRICGQIFCSNCTTNIAGDKFGHSGKIKVCSRCLQYANDYDGSSEESSIEDIEEDDDRKSVMTTDESKMFQSTQTPPPRMAIATTRNGDKTVEIQATAKRPSFSHSGQSIYNVDMLLPAKPPVRSFQSFISKEKGDSSFIFEFGNSPFSSSGLGTYLRRSGSHSNLKSPTFSIQDDSEVDSEDERSMSLYAALNNDTEQREFRSIDRAQASLERMRRRRPGKGRSNTTSLGGRKEFGFETKLKPTRRVASESGVFAMRKSELSESSEEYLQRLMTQAINDKGVDESWTDVLWPLFRKVEQINPNVRATGSLDVKQYLKIKRIEGSSAQECRLVNGIVFSKTLALKSMPRSISSPRIALIMFPLEYVREQHFMSLEPMIAQEKEYLRKLVSRITALSPDVVLVGAGVSGVALKLLKDAGIAVIYNMKPQVIERIAKLTRADIAISFDKLAHLKLGTCESFEVKSFLFGNTIKTYTFITGCDPNLGGTLLLRGGNDELLRKVKEVSEAMVYTVFGLKLESAFLNDNFLLSTPAKQENTDSGYFQEFVKDFNSRLLSISPAVKFALPYPLLKARKLETLLNIKLVENANIVQGPNYKVEKFMSDQEVLMLQEQFKIKTRQWEVSHTPRMLQTSAHQNITVLYSMVSTKSATPCIGPQLVTIDFFWENDISLGQYFENIISTANAPCTGGCGGLLLNHYRSYVHGSGKVDVMIEKQNRLPSLQNIIMTWSYCKICGVSTPVLQMNSNTWNYSLGKYLELIFWSKLGVVGCPHDYAKDHIKYCSLNDVVVRMEYSPVELFDIIMPSTKMHWVPDMDVKLKVQLHASIMEKIINFYASVESRLNRVKVDNLEKLESAKEKITELKKRAGEEKDALIQIAKEIYEGLQPDEHMPLNAVIRSLNDSSVGWDIEFSQFEKEFLPTETDIARITALQLKKLFLDEPKKEEVRKSVDSNMATKPDSISAPSLLSMKTVPVLGATMDLQTAVERGKLVEASADRTNSTHSSRIPSTSETDSHSEAQLPKAASLVPSAEEMQFITSSSVIAKPVPRLSPTTECGSGCLNLNPVFSNDSFALEFSSQKTPTKSDLVVDNETTPVGGLADFDTPTKAIGSTSIQVKSPKEGGEAPQTPTRPSITRTQRLSLASLTPTKKSSNLSLGAPKGKKEVRQFSNGSSVHSTKSNDISNVRRAASKIEAAIRNPSQGSVHSVSSVVHVPSPVPTDDQTYSESDKKSSSKELERQLQEGRDNSFSSQISEESKVHQLAKIFDQMHLEALSKEFELQREMERLELNKKKYKAYRVKSSKPIVEVFKDVQDAVDEAPPEDTSAIASDSTEEEVNAVVSQKSATPPPAEKTSLMKTLTNFWADRSATLWKPLDYPLSPSEHIFVDSDVVIREDEPSSLVAFCLSSSDYLDKMASITSEQTDLESVLTKKTGIHLKYQYQESAAVLSCKIFFAEQFDAFRKKCGCDDKYITSLSRCVKWDSSGGKSGSAFLKTLDDRLVIKELSHSELDSFVRFAPSYFEYMGQALFHDLPTALAKIFGFYQIQIKNQVTGKNFKMDVLVMENLFYKKNPSRIFDLKGSMRNRHVEQTGKANEVLLDENMVEFIYESPLFVREYDKKLLRASLWNDTLFLAKMNVMDYSLVIGIDYDTHSMTVGIIDCMRTFTWDKKLESWVKEKGLVGGKSNKEPTVVTPRQYKNRFREAMERYILMVPDPWYQETN